MWMKPERLTEAFLLRMTSSERKLLASHAQAVGLSQNEFLRQCLRQAVEIESLKKDGVFCETKGN